MATKLTPTQAANDRLMKRYGTDDIRVAASMRREDILLMRAEGLKLKEIAAEFGISFQMVYKLIRIAEAKGEVV